MLGQEQACAAPSPPARLGGGTPASGAAARDGRGHNGVGDGRRWRSSSSPTTVMARMGTCMRVRKVVVVSNHSQRDDHDSDRGGDHGGEAGLQQGHVEVLVEVQDENDAAEAWSLPPPGWSGHWEATQERESGFRQRTSPGEVR